MTGLSLHRMTLQFACTAATVIVSGLALPGCHKSGPTKAEASSQSNDKGGKQGEVTRAATADPADIDGALAPVVEIQNEDYAVARSQFQTNLIRKSSAPQPWSPITPPAGVTEIEYPSGNWRFKAWVNRPGDDTHKNPAVLFLHGGFAFDKDDWDLSQPFRDAGFVVLTPMLRGENGQAGSFTLWYDEVDDVLAAAAYLSAQPYVDVRHLYVAGASAGGTLALFAALASTQFQAAASYSASPDQALLVKHAKMDLPFDRTNPRELQLRSPLAYAASFKCPVRIYYATQDHFVLTSQRTAELAKSQGLDVESIRMEGDHGSIVLPSIKESIKFFQRSWRATSDDR
jgi:dienelactone hydrolase